MRVGVPREIKIHEYRVGLVPAGVRELVAAGHEVLVESGAGNGIGVDDAQFRAAGAAIAARASEVFERADMVVKVKEPQPAECEMLRQGQVLFTYLHLAADPVQARGLMKSGAATIERLVRDADLVVGAVLVAGAAAPKLLTRAMIATMKPGAVLVDISIDQGGCFETSRPTTHAEPTFVVDGVIHYCVANMPGAVPRTSTLALTNATLPYVRALADLGWQAALRRDPGLAAGLNVHAGEITHEVVAKALGLKARPGIR